MYRHDGSTDNSWYSYQCGHCDRLVTGAVLSSFERPDGKRVMWLLCPNCADGSVLTTDGSVVPSVAFGPTIQGLPNGVSKAYKEVRNCLSVDAFTACELVCRKILMHVAVEKGAKEGESFVDYLAYLEDKGFITPPMKDWVDLIRQHGNKAAHLLEKVDRERAESTLMFTAELLRLVYEMEHMAKQYTQPPKTDSI